MSRSSRFVLLDEEDGAAKAEERSESLVDLNATPSTEQGSPPGSSKQCHRPRVEVLDKPRGEKDPPLMLKEPNPRVAEPPEVLEKFMMAPLMSAWSEEKEVHKDWQDKPQMKEQLALPDDFALKNMAILSIADLLQEKFVDLAKSKFDLRSCSFVIPVGRGVRWQLNPLFQRMPQTWPVDKMADFCAGRYVSPLEFMEMLNVPDDAVMDWSTMTLIMTNPDQTDLFQFNFLGAYSSFLNAVEDKERQFVMMKHRQLVKSRKDPTRIYSDMLKHGKLLLRVRTTDYYRKAFGESSGIRCCVQDIEHLPELQLGLVSEHNTTFIMLSHPLPREIEVIKDKMWDIATDNLRRLYVKKTWIHRAEIQAGSPLEGKIYCLESYKVECLSFVATTMFMPERMREASKIDVYGDVVMVIARDDAVFFTGSKDEWGMAYLAHIRCDMQEHQAYVGTALRLVTLDDGILAWELYSPRTGDELVLPCNRVEIDVFTANVRTAMKPAGCANCFSVISKLMCCSRCHDIFYCSKDCQKLHWKKHKKYCIKRTGKDCETEAKKAVVAAAQIKPNHPAQKASVYADRIRKNIPKKYHEQLNFE